MFKKHDLVFSEFVQKIDSIRKYKEYKCFFGKHGGLEKKRFNRVHSSLFLKDFKWPFGIDEIWFKGEVVIPEKIAGISVTGSSVTLNHMSACASKLYINGVKLIDEKWWIDKDIQLSDSLKANELFDITLCLKRIDGNHFFRTPKVFIDRIETIHLEIDSFFRTMKFIKKLINLGEIKDKRLIALFHKTVRNIPIDLLKNEMTQKFVDYVKESERILLPFSEYLKEYSTYLIGHAHLDMNWLWDWQNTLGTAIKTSSKLKNLLSNILNSIFHKVKQLFIRQLRTNSPPCSEIFKRW